jgi:sugar phosphate isomerase/epimerase
MSGARFVLSAFGDEIGDDLAHQIALLAGESVHAIELRGAWGKNVLDLDDGEVRHARTLLDAAGCAVSAIGSPIGKSALDLPRAFELERLDRAARLAAAFGISAVRIFSFYVGGDPAARRDEVLARLQLLAERAQALGLTLLHENEKDIYGDTAVRCHDIVSTIDSPALRAAFDPANFVQCGVRPMTEAWPLLAPYVAHVHIKDAVLADGTVRPAGEGDGEIAALLAALDARGYRGYLVLEPHLQLAGPAGGFSGEAGMRRAAAALRGLLAPYRVVPAAAGLHD